MFSVLIAIVYLAFVSLGLPDSLLGAAWPVMREELSMPISGAGVVSMTIAAGTVLSSLFSDRLTCKLGTGRVTAISVAMTALALFGFSTATSFIWLCVWAVPYGLGAGAVDAALNNFAALRCSSRHMSWLHGCWGVGAAISPYIMSACLAGERGWRMGYLTVSVIQIALTAILFVSLPLWRNAGASTSTQSRRAQPLRKVVTIRGVVYVMLAFFCYCAMESTTGLWASSYLVEHSGFDAKIAASFASLFFIGMMLGRFLCGFVAEKIGDRLMIRVGILVVLLGLLLLALPSENGTPTLIGLCVTGLGSAPIYPSIIHSTPINFGVENSQAIVGVQMASAYIGSTFMPPLFGLLAQHISVGLYPFYLLFFALLMLCMSERLNQIAPTKS